MEIPRRLVRALQLGTVIVVAAVLAGCTTTVAGSAQAAASRPSSSHPTGTPTTGQGTPSVPAKVPGWQVVVATKAGIAYDAPPDWKVQTPDTVVGFQDPQGNPVVTMNYAAVYKAGYCTGHSGSFRAESGINSVPTADPGQAASDLAQKVAMAAYTNGSVTPTVTAGTPQPITVAGDNGMVVRDTLTVTPQSSCDPPGAEVYVVALPLAQPNTGCGVMVVVADQGTPDAAADQELQQMIGSLRAG